MTIPDRVAAYDSSSGPVDPERSLEAGRGPIRKCSRRAVSQRDETRTAAITLAPCPHCGAPEAPERMDSPLRKLTFLIVRADEHTRDPIDLNYVAIPRDAWEDILAVVKRG